MDSKEFKNIFDEFAIRHGFEKAFGGWFKESSECIAVLNLQKSNYGNYYQLLIKIYIQGIFGIQYSKNKDLVKKDIGDIFGGEPKEYKDLFNFDNFMDDDERKIQLESLFISHIKPFVDKTSTKSGIIEMHKSEGLFLIPNVKKELEIA
jgi:hypothetical protein